MKQNNLFEKLHFISLGMILVISFSLNSVVATKFSETPIPVDERIRYTDHNLWSRAESDKDRLMEFNDTLNLSHWTPKDDNLSNCHDEAVVQAALKEFDVDYPYPDDQNFFVYTSKDFMADLKINEGISGGTLFFPPPPPIYSWWTINVVNSRGSSAWVNLYLDGIWKEAVNIANGNSIIRSYLVEANRYHTFYSIVFDFDINAPIRNKLYKNIRQSQMDTIYLNDDSGLSGNRYFDVILVKTSDTQYTQGELDQIRDQAITTAYLIDEYYNEFSYNHFRYKIRGIIGWFQTSLTTSEVNNDHTAFWHEAIQLADSSRNFYLTDSVVAVYTGPYGSATGYIDVHNTVDGGSGDGAYKVAGRVVIPDNYAGNSWAWAHEFGHTLELGHPNLYEGTPAEQYWSLMGANGAHMSSYAKWALKWLSLDLRNNGEVLLGFHPTALSQKNYGDSVLAYKTSRNSIYEFYLIEFREWEDPYEGENGPAIDMVIIYKTTSIYEVTQAYNNDFYDEWLIYNCLDVVQCWEEPFGGTLSDTFFGDTGFQVEILWFVDFPPILYFNQ